MDTAIDNGDRFDIVIIGAGPAGLSFTRSLRDLGLRLAIVEQLPTATLADPPYDGREIALTWRSVRLLSELGIWQRIAADERFAMRGARVLNGANPAGLEIRPPRLRGPFRLAGGLAGGLAGEPNADELGYLVSNHLIRRAAWQAMREDTRTTLFAQTRVQAVETDRDGARVTLADGRVLHAKLLVAADSRFSDTRRRLGISARHLDFGKTMMVCRMRHACSHENVATEWFGDRQTLALLPLGESQSSVVLTLPQVQIEKLKDLPPAEFERDIGRRFMNRLGAMHLASERFLYPLVAVYPDRLVTTRCATIGDAAVGMHPVTAHGFNLGLMSADALARGIAREYANRRQHADPGSDSLLREYETTHRRASRPLFLATNAIVRLYTDDSPPAKLLRGALLGIAKRAPLVSDRLAKALMQTG